MMNGHTKHPMPHVMPCYLGYDRREDLAYKVARHSIERRSIGVDAPVIPLVQDALRAAGMYLRPADLKASTDFSLTRFTVPLLQFHTGWALYADCDFLFTENVLGLYGLRDESKAVQVVKHQYTATETMKMDGQQQTVYPCKNWSSLILWNCSHPSNQNLTEEVLNEAAPADLHRFGWLDESEIGELPVKWNHLVGVYERSEEVPSGIHYTLGFPGVKGYENCDYSDLWLAELDSLMAWDKRSVRIKERA